MPPLDPSGASFAFLARRLTVCRGCIKEHDPHRLGRESLDVTLGYLKGKDAESEEAQEHAAVIHAYGSPDELKFEDMPDPSPEPGEVLIRTAATSINPLDVKMRSGAVKEYFPVSFPAILGWDVSGTVEKVGPGVKNFTKGTKSSHRRRKQTPQCAW